jgi:subtilisin-like proprotein convertase family protein
MGTLVVLVLAFSAAPAGAAVFTGGPITLSDAGPASPYPSEITVADIDGTITKLTVTLTGLTHTFPADLDILLVGPTGANVALLADWGAGTDVVDADLTFDDFAPQVPNPIVSGTWHPTVGSGAVGCPPPAPVGTWGVALSTYRDTSPNGTWSLYVYDDLAGDTGSLGGWSLDISVAAPSISGFSPSSAPAGAAVKVFGDGFTGASAVTFNSTAATSFTVDSDNRITVTVPVGATTGPVSVTTAAGTAASATDFTVVPAPTVGDFAPVSGPVGTAVTVTGAGFTGATAVTFDGVAATDFTVDSDTQITATVPAGATTGRVSVVTPNGSGASATNFTVLVPSRFTLKLSGLTNRVLALGEWLGVKGVVRPADAGGGKVRLTVQQKRGGRWTKSLAVERTLSPSGSYDWQYRPVRKGAYRIKSAIFPTAMNTLVTTPWHRFFVK